MHELVWTHLLLTLQKQQENYFTNALFPLLFLYLLTKHNGDYNSNLQMTSQLLLKKLIF